MSEKVESWHSLFVNKLNVSKCFVCAVARDKRSRRGDDGRITTGGEEGFNSVMRWVGNIKRTVKDGDYPTSYFSDELIPTRLHQRPRL